MNPRDAQHGPNRFGDDDAPRPNGHANGQPNGHANGSGDSSNNRRNLSEISHLFLSDLRSLNGSGRTPPKRTPPGGTPPRRPDETIDIAPAEMEGAGDDDVPHVPPVQAVIGARLNGALIRRASEFAASLGATRPVGLVLVEDATVRLLSVTAGSGADEGAPGGPLVVSTAAALRDAVIEMGCDLDRWLVVVGDPRCQHARRLLAAIDEWVLLTVAQHEGVIAGYRTLKGLCDLPMGEPGEDGGATIATPHVTVAMLDATSDADARLHAKKLIGVCRQFLKVDIRDPDDLDEPKATGAMFAPRSSVGAHAVREVVIAALPASGSAELWPTLGSILCPGAAAQAPHLSPEDTEGDFAMFDAAQPTPRPMPEFNIPSIALPPSQRPMASRAVADEWVPQQALNAAEEVSEVQRRMIDLIEVPDVARPPEPQGRPRGPQGQPVPATNAAPAAVVPPPAAVAPAPVSAEPAGRFGGEDEVLDLPLGASVADAVLTRMGVAATPLVPPMLAGGRLCVDRSGELLLVAAAAPGLTDLPSIGRAVTWANDNAQLIGMALAQYRLAQNGTVGLHLLVSRADANAEALRPLMGTGRVSVQSYRRLTWGGRCGVLLDAA